MSTPTTAARGRQGAPVSAAPRFARRALRVVVLAATLWATGGGQAAAAPPQVLVEPGCISGSDGFIVRLCLETPPPLGGAGARDAPPATESVVLFLEAVRTGAADLRVERTVPAAELVVIAAAVERDVPAVEREYGVPFRARPLIQVFATVMSFEEAVQVLYRYPATVARALGLSGGGMDRPSGTIVVNWARVRGDRVITIFRHELSHLMVRQIVGVDTAVPAWFDEGLATLSQYALADRPDAAVNADYVASALLSTQRLSLAQLVTTESWLRASATAGPAVYAVAGSATATLRGDVGQAGVNRILALTASGRSFEDAFEAVTRRSVASFISGAGETIAGRAAPEIAVAAVPDARGDLVFTVRGFPPGGTVELTFDGVGSGGEAYHHVYSASADATGSVRGSFGSTAPAGTYALRAKAGSITAAAVMRTTR